VKFGICGIDMELAGGIRGTGRYGRLAGIAGSIRFNASKLHHLAPLFLLKYEKRKALGLEVPPTLLAPPTR